VLSAGATGATGATRVSWSLSSAAPSQSAIGASSRSRSYEVVRPCPGGPGPTPGRPKHPVVVRWRAATTDPRGPMHCRSRTNRELACIMSPRQRSPCVPPPTANQLCNATVCLGLGRFFVRFRLYHSGACLHLVHVQANDTC
jgi:hypothetical protein